MLKKLKKLLIIVLAVIAALSVLYIAWGLLVTKSFTLVDVFEAFGLEAGPAVQQTVTDSVPPAEDEVKVTFLYIGQGDSAVIQAGDTTVLVDTGEYENVDLLENFLQAEGIRDIDLLIISHPHTDHMGSAQTMLRKYNVGEVLFAYVPERLTPTNTTYENFLLQLERSDVPVRIPEVGEIIALDRGTIEVFFAGGEDCHDLNNCSLVFQYVWGDNSFLFTGDAEFVVEDALCKQFGSRLASTVLKVGHHGTKKATGNNLLKEVGPEYAVLSCGINNEYGYPKEAVINRLTKAGANYLRTDLDGNITFVCTKTQIKVYTENEVA